MKITFFLLMIALSIQMFSGQSVNIYNENKKEVEIFIPVKSYYDGSQMNSSKVDNILYKNINGKFYKKTIASDIVPQVFGAKGDSKYYTSKDVNKLESGSDDTVGIEKFINSRKKINFSGNHVGGSSLYFPQSIYKSFGSYTINDNNTLLLGDGSNASIIHALNDGKNNDQPLLTFSSGTTKNNWENLLSGGGAEKMSFRTDNSNIRNFGLKLIFTEYMTFRDLNIEGFGKSAISGSFWESYFDNIKLAGCGALQTSDANGKPLSGVFDISNNDPNRKDLSNNTLINKLTFSSCFGTLLKLTATTAQSSNFNLNGLYAETYFGDAGKVDNLPLIYVSDAVGNSINGGFITINSTGVLRNASVVEMNSISELKLSNLTITFNPFSNDFESRPVRKLKNIFQLSSANSKIFLNTLTINDQTDGIGYGIDSVPPLVSGIGICNLTDVIFNLKSSKSRGTRRLTNIIDRKLKANGNIIIILSDKNGEIPSQRQTVNFNDGKINLYSESIPISNDTWEEGDEITNIDRNKTSYICTSSGTTGELTNRKASGEKNSNSIILNDSSSLLEGDWIEIEGLEGYNRISAVVGKKIILEQKLSKSFLNVRISFHKPKWRELICN